jgi:hypothetical protein
MHVFYKPLSLCAGSSLTHSVKFQDSQWLPEIVVNPKFYVDPFFKELYKTNHIKLLPLRLRKHLMALL